MKENIQNKNTPEKLKGDVWISIDNPTNNEGESIAEAYLQLQNHPRTHYLIDSIEVLPEYQGRGYGTDILHRINTFLEKKNIIGLLHNMAKSDKTIELYNIQNKQQVVIEDFYKKNGWHYFDGGGITMMYIPKGFTDTLTITEISKHYQKRF